MDNKALDRLNIVDKLGVGIYAKNLNGEYVFCNYQLAYAAGFDSPESVLGKTDYECVWRDQAEHYASIDAQALAGKSIVNLHEVQTTSFGVRDVIVSINALFTQSGKAAGVIGHYVDITGCALSPKEGRYDPRTRKIMLSERFNGVHLTYRESQIYYYALMGYSSARIAVKLNRAKRTITFHIESLKEKLNCVNKSELIELGNHSGINHTLFVIFSKKPPVIR